MWMINEIRDAKNTIDDMESSLIGIECTYGNQDAMVHDVNSNRETIEILTYDEDGYEDQFIRLSFEEFEDMCS